MPEPPESAAAPATPHDTPGGMLAIDGPGVSRAVPRDLLESTLTMLGHGRRAGDARLAAVPGSTAVGVRSPAG